MEPGWNAVTRLDRDEPTVFTRQVGNRLGVVMQVEGPAESWAFVVFDLGLAIGGARDATWALDAAFRQADEELDD